MLRPRPSRPILQHAQHPPPPRPPRPSQRGRRNVRATTHPPARSTPASSSAHAPAAGEWRPPSSTLNTRLDHDRLARHNGDKPATEWSSAEWTPRRNGAQRNGTQLNGARAAEWGATEWIQGGMGAKGNGSAVEWAALHSGGLAPLVLHQPVWRRGRPVSISRSLHSRSGAVSAGPSAGLAPSLISRSGAGVSRSVGR